MIGRCPRCGKAIEWAAGGGPLARGNLYRPFCSDRRWPFGQRCKLIDLGKWIDEEYRIAGEDSPSRVKGEGREGVVYSISPSCHSLSSNAIFFHFIE